MAARRRDDRHVGPGGRRPAAAPARSAPEFTTVRPYGTGDQLPPELPPELPEPEPVAPAAVVAPRPRVRPKRPLPSYGQNPAPAPAVEPPRPVAPAAPAPTRRPLPGTVRRALFDEFPDEPPATSETLPLWAAVCRGVAAWLGLVAAATALAVPSGVPFPTDPWWLDATPLPPQGTRFGLAAWGLTAFLGALLPSLPGPLRFGGSFGAAVIAGLSLRATAIHLAAARDGLFHATPTLPLPFFVAVLAVVALFGLRHAGGRMNWSAALATPLAFLAAAAGLTLTHVATAARLDDRGPADAAITLAPSEEIPAGSIATALEGAKQAGFVPAIVDGSSDLAAAFAEAREAADAVAHDEETFGPRVPTVLFVGPAERIAAARLAASRAGVRVRAIPLAGDRATRAARLTGAAADLWRSYLPPPAFMAKVR